MAIKIIIDENIPHATEIFSNLGQVVLKNGRDLSPSDIDQADALVIRSVTKVNKKLIEHSKVKFIGTCTIGTDHVDTSYLNQRGIHFRSAPGCNAQAVAEYVITNLLYIAKSKNTTLQNKTLGIIGVGNVGSIVNEYALAIGMKPILCDLPLQEIQPQKNWSNFENTLRSDFITFHVPLNLEGRHKTFHMINGESIKHLSETSTLINSCRGEVIDTEVLLNSIKSNMIGHTVIDVWENEPNISLELLENTFLSSPHIAGYTYEAKIRGATMIAKELQTHFSLKEQSLDEIGRENTPPIQINISTNQTTEEVVLECCLAFFDPTIDNIALKSVINDPHIGKTFDNLRKNYRKRREFQTIPVKFTGASPGPALLEILKKLKFNVVN